MLQPMVSFSAGPDAAIGDSSLAGELRGTQAGLTDQSDFDRVMKDYQSSDNEPSAVKELAADSQQTSQKSGENSPLLSSDTADQSDSPESDSLENAEENDGLLSYLMANAGVTDGQSVTVNWSAHGEIRSSELGIELQTVKSDLMTLGGEAEGEIQAFAFGVELSEQPDGMDVLVGSVSSVGSQTSGVPIQTGDMKPLDSLVTPSGLTADTSLSPLASGISNTVRQSLATPQSQTLNQVPADVSSQLLTQQNLTGAGKQGDLSQDALLAKQQVQLDDLTEVDLDKKLQTGIESLHSGNSHIKQQVSSDILNIQQNDSLSRPVRLANAASALSEKIQTMIGSNTQSATVRLDPPELGSLEIRVHVKNDQAHIQIVAATPQIREALEQQSARLREALVDQGLNLSNLDVSDQQTQDRGSDDSGSGRRGGVIADTIQSEESETIVSTRLGFVDHYV
jgi:flagellar hook-length control protein FliK